MRLAARRPELLKSVTLLETTGERDVPLIALQGRASLLARRVLGAHLATKVLPTPTMRLLYSKTFRHDPGRRDEYKNERASIAEVIRTTSPAVVAGVLSRRPVQQELARINLPTLVIVGEEDVPTPPKQARRLATANTAPATTRPTASASHTAPAPLVVPRRSRDRLT